MALRIGSLELGLVPRIAVPLTDTDLAGHAERVGRLADIAELRIDQLQRVTPAAALALAERARALGLPLIATVRDRAEGGAAELDDTQRWALYEELAPLVDAVDVELHTAIRDRVVALARRHHKLAIVSHHDFTATPIESDLAALADAAATHGADIIKVAAYAASSTDLDRLLDLLRARRGQHLIVIAMGPRGTVSRVFFPVLGSLITYGFVQQANAPGQLPLEELYDALRRYSPEFAAARPGR